MPYDTDSDPYAALDKRKYDYKKTILPALAGMVSGSALSAMRGNSPRQATINAMLGGIGGGAGAFGNALEQQSTYNKELANLINQNLWKQKEFDQKQARYDIDKLHKQKKMDKIDQDMANAGKPKDAAGAGTSLVDEEKQRVGIFELSRAMQDPMKREDEAYTNVLGREKDRREGNLALAQDKRRRYTGRSIDGALLPTKASNLEFSKPELPKNIQTTSQAVKYLNERYDMDQNTAAQWINKNYVLR